VRLDLHNKLLNIKYHRASDGGSDDNESLDYGNKIQYKFKREFSKDDSYIMKRNYQYLEFEEMHEKRQVEYEIADIINKNTNIEEIKKQLPIS